MSSEEALPLVLQLKSVKNNKRLVTDSELQHDGSILGKGLHCQRERCTGYLCKLLHNYKEAIRSPNNHFKNYCTHFLHILDNDNFCPTCK